MEARIRLALVAAWNQRRAGCRWRGFTCSEECRTTRMLCPIRVRSSRAVTIFESGKPITRLMGRPSGLAAATHDVAIEIAKRGRLINHRIDPAVDAERDFVGIDLTNTLSVSRQEYLHSADPVFQAQTASGETYHSDSRILLLDLQPVSPNNTDVAGQPSAVVQATLPIAATAESFQSNLTSPY